jgi:hypothetical protein
VLKLTNSSTSDTKTAKKVSHRVKKDRNILHTAKRKANWIGHILRRNCLLNHVIEGKIGGLIEVTGIQERRRKLPIDDLTETTEYLKFKEEVLRSHCVGDSLWKRLRTCRETNQEMDGFLKSKLERSVHTKYYVLSTIGPK